MKFSTETRSVICSKAETGFVKCIGGKQAIYDGDKFRNIPRRSYRDRLITTLGLTNRTTLPEKRKARADVPSKWGIV